MSAPQRLQLQDVEVEREADDRLARLSDAEQKVWVLSNMINERGFHVDRKFAEAARKIAQAAAPEIDAELAELTEGAVTAIDQIEKMKEWLKAQGCDTSSLDSKTIEKLLEDEDLRTARASRIGASRRWRPGRGQEDRCPAGARRRRRPHPRRVRISRRVHRPLGRAGYQPQNLKSPRLRISTPRSRRSRPATTRT